LSDACRDVAGVGVSTHGQSLLFDRPPCGLDFLASILQLPLRPSPRGEPALLGNVQADRRLADGRRPYVRAGDFFVTATDSKAGASRMSAVAAWWERWANAGLSFVYPETCQICSSHRATKDEGYVCARCWSGHGGVRFIRPPFCERCGLPYEGDI